MLHPQSKKKIGKEKSEPLIALVVSAFAFTPL